jgi:hypothetical protein
VTGGRKRRAGLRLARALVRRLGRRGSFLLFLAFLDFVLPIGFPSLPPPARDAYAAALPIGVWMVLWWAVGGVCLAYAWLRVDWPAFAAAASIKVGWGMASFLAWAGGDLPRGWVGSVVWWAFCVVILLVSTWPEAPAFGGGDEEGG